MLNASSTNCNREGVFASSAKLQLNLPVRGLEWRIRKQNVALKIHFPVPKCSCKQGTKNVFNRCDPNRKLVEKSIFGADEI